MLHIFVMHGKVVQVIEDIEEPQPRMLKEDKDYTVEYIPCKAKRTLADKVSDWLIPKVYKPEETDTESLTEEDVPF